MDFTRQGDRRSMSHSCLAGHTTNSSCLSWHSRQTNWYHPDLTPSLSVPSPSLYSLGHSKDQGMSYPCVLTLQISLSNIVSSQDKSVSLVSNSAHPSQWCVQSWSPGLTIDRGDYTQDWPWLGGPGVVVVVEPASASQSYLCPEPQRTPRRLMWGLRECQLDSMEILQFSKPKHMGLLFHHFYYFMITSQYFDLVFIDSWVMV